MSENTNTTNTTMPETPANKNIDVPQFNFNGSLGNITPPIPGVPQTPVQTPQAPPVQPMNVPPVQPNTTFMPNQNVNVGIKRQPETNIDIAVIGYISPQRTSLKRQTINPKLAKEAYTEIIRILKKYNNDPSEKDKCSFTAFSALQKEVLDGNGAIKTNTKSEVEKVSLDEKRFSIKIYRSFFFGPESFDLGNDTPEKVEDKKKLDSLCYSAIAKKDFYSVDMSEDKVEFLIFRDYTKNDLSGGVNYGLQLTNVQTKGDNDRLFILTDKQLKKLAVSAKVAHYNAGVDVQTDDGAKVTHIYRPAGVVAFTTKKVTKPDSSGQDNEAKKTVAVLKYYTTGMVECKVRDLCDIQGNRLATVPHRNMVAPLDVTVTEEQIPNAKTYRERWGQDPTKLGKRMVISSKDMPSREEFKLAKQGQIIPYSEVAPVLNPLGVTEAMWNHLSTTVREKRVTTMTNINKAAQEALAFLSKS